MRAEKVTEATLMDAIIARFPGFKPMWEQHLAFWEDASRARMIGNDVAEFSAYVREVLGRKERTEELEQIFAFAEELMREGDEDVKDQIATNFLENLVNSAGQDPAYDALFVSLLGPESLGYCKEWNRFSGGGIPALENA
jgi:hypothetical protein